MTPTLCSSPRKSQQQKDSSRLGVWSKSSMLAHKIGYIYLCCNFVCADMCDANTVTAQKSRVEKTRGPQIVNQVIV